PLKGVEVKIDGGAWRPAVIDRHSTAYSWKLFTCFWEDATPGTHTIVSRAIDAYGRVQPEAGDLELKKTYWEDNSQFVRTVKIS
ncbi:MAG: sulfite oxidase, partial [Acidobacteria bacterium]|nr:sulfite oxidase [Acidobacteriota bacterium]